MRAAFAIVAATLLLAGCGDGDGDALVIYCAVDRDAAEPAIDAFTRETGIRTSVLYDTETAKAAGLAKRVELERGAPRADVWWSGEALFTARLEAGGLLGPLAARPESRPSALPATAHWVAVSQRFRVLVWRRDLWPPELPPPSTLDLLADPRLRGRCALARPLAGSTASHAAVLASTEDGRALLRAIRANEPRLLAGNADVARAVALGQVLLGLVDTDDAVVFAATEPRLAAVIPDQAPGGRGAMAVPMTVAIVAGAHHAALAQRFVEWLRVQSVRQPVLPGSWSSDEAPPPPGFPPRGALRLMPVDWARLAADFERHLTFVTEVLGP